MNDLGRKRIRLVMAGCACAAVLFGSADAAWSQTQAGPSAQELHDGIMAAIHANAAGAALPQGDTFVVWRAPPNPGPILYSTVSRQDSVLATSLVRNDGMLGTSVATWRGRVVSQVAVRWQKGDSTLQEVLFVASGGQVHASGSWDTTFAAPGGPWAIADYGMDDQVVPLVRQLPADSSVHLLTLLRPYARKWDTVRVHVVRRPWGILARVVNADGRVATWAVSEEGDLTRIINGPTPNAERLPVPLTRLAPEYLKVIRTEGG